MIYNISSVHSFADLLVQQVLEKAKNDVWKLSKMSVFVPTRRAALTLKEAFVKNSGTQTILLPKIIPLADLDTFLTDIPEPIGRLERQLLLMKLILAKQPTSFDKAFEMAASLAEFLDEIENFDIDPNRLKDIVPNDFAEHWQQTIDFLEIIMSFWPQILQEKQKSDIVAYKNQLLKDMIAHWKENPPSRTIIAAGFTGGLPIIEDFLLALSHLPDGHIYLPDVDLKMPDEVWDNLDETHPQFEIKRLIDKLSVSRKQIQDICPVDSQRFDFVSVSMYPSDQTQKWQTMPAFSSNVLDGLSYIECQTPQTEALTIAFYLRQVLQTPNKTAALVTTDRDLARRVISQMRQWDIELDDSAGKTLLQTPLGTYLLLLANAAVSGEDTDLLALLKHPLATDGDAFNSFRMKVHQWEKEARKDKRTFCPPLTTDLSPFFNFFSNPVLVPFKTLLLAHIKVAEALATSKDKSGAERLWSKEWGQKASDLFTELLEYADKIGDIQPVTYPAFLTSLLKNVSFRPKYGMHPRLDILGPIEARMQHPDCVIIAGMNEGTWPAIPDTSPWINRPMRTTLGLPLPEAKIGVSAHDFVHTMMAKEVIITRSLKVDGTPTRPSRWLMRMQAVLEASNLSLVPLNEDIVDLTQTPATVTPSVRPQPVVPVRVRPTKLSFTQIETLKKDPYAIYASKILKLLPLEDLNADLSIRDFGIIIHKSLERFLKEYPKERKIDVLEKIGIEELQKTNLSETKQAFFMAKWKKIAVWFITQQSKTQGVPYFLEKEISVVFPLNEEKNFTLCGKIDRVDKISEDEALLIDYKTGTPPSLKEVRQGYSPQLPLEALALRKSFPDFPPVKQMEYWQISGKDSGGKVVPVSSPEEIISKAEEGFLRLLRFFEKEDTPYVACPDLDTKPRYNDYEHLERLAEWSTQKDEDADE